MKIFIIVTSCLLFTFLNIFISNRAFLSNSNLFQNINIIQILTPVIQIFLALCIAYFVHIKIVNKNKSVDILIDMLEKYSESLNDINDLTIKYIREKNEDDSKNILWKLKKASISHKQFELIYKLYPNINFVYDITEMKKNLLNLKKSITNDYFRQEGEYTAEQKTLILKYFQEIETNIYKEKKNLFS